MKNFTNHMYTNNNKKIFPIFLLFPNKNKTQSQLNLSQIYFPLYNNPTQKHERRIGAAAYP